MGALLSPVAEGRPTFLRMPRCTDLTTLDADVAVIGVPYGVPYGMEGTTSPSSTAPAAVREQSLRMVPFLSHYDYDFGGEILAGRNVRIVDCGDVAMTPGRYDENNVTVADAIREIHRRGAVAIVLGGDHAIPIPVMRGFDEVGSMYVVQLDAHLDWRDERFGVRDGLSSPMRRASELPWVSGMAQLGIRGVGSARKQEVDDARAYGSLIIGAREIHQAGVEALLERIPDAENYYITLDADGLDPAIAPGVGSPSYGGLSYYEASDILRGIAAKGNVVGFDFVEIMPGVDIGNRTSLLAARLTLNLIGALAHNGRIGPP